MQLIFDHPGLKQACDTLTRQIRRAGGRALLVGGSVRDALLGERAKDLDFEVHGLGPEALRATLDEHFSLDLVGQSFGVLKIRHLPIDVALPRRESKQGTGHRGFEIFSDPELGFREAARRRDFTLNAIGYDPLDQELLDPWGGCRDLEQGVLRHVSEQFSEDPLRVLRAMQLAARFRLRVAPETLALCRTIEPEGLPRERLLDEWKKLILRGQEISRGLGFLRDCGWLRYYPELEVLVDCPQDPEWHPEGDVWVHTLHVMDAFAGERRGDDWEDLVVGFGCLCHDLGKPATTSFIDGRYRSPGHEEEGEEPTRSFLARLTNQEMLVDQVVPLVRDHLKPYLFWRDKAGAAAIRRLARRVGRIDRLVRLARADHAGRPPLPFDGFPAGDWLLDQAKSLALEAAKPRPLVQGRHLIALGLEPGPHFGPLLERCFEEQLDGTFETLEDGLEIARRVVEDHRAGGA